MVSTLLRRRRHSRHLRALDPFVDGELEPAQAAAVLDHLDRCWGCRGELGLRRLIKASTARIGTRTQDDARA